MTPGARIAAAIEILDRVTAGTPAEQALTGWGRASRFAGSGDRLAVRDLVFDALRQRRSLAWIGGADTGRGLMLGLARRSGWDVAVLFSGQGHAPLPRAAEEVGLPSDQAPPAVAHDLPDWIWSLFQRDLGPGAGAAADAQRQRAPVWVRVNLARADRAAAQAALAAAGIATQPAANVRTALQITENPRKLSSSAPYMEGLVELQDARSQQAILQVPLRIGDRVLDYCAGGGGKALALAALGAVVTAHDAHPRRMADLPARAQRAHVTIAQSSTDRLSELPPFDGVFVDAPCSGSGTWRRTPDAKWRLTPLALQALTELQATVLRQAAHHVGPSRWLAYATCSLLTEENEAVLARFCAERPDFALQSVQTWLPDGDGDGFFLGILRREG